jgi:hypothetical protein
MAKKKKSRSSNKPASKTVNIGRHEQNLHHLRRLEQRQMREHDKRLMGELEKQAQELSARAGDEGRHLSRALHAVIVPAMWKMLMDLRKEAKRGKLSDPQIRIAQRLANKGFREAEEILNAHFQHECKK